MGEINLQYFQIIRVELMPDILQGLKWHVQFCLRVPPSAAPIVPVGNPAIHIVRLKILFFVSKLFVPFEELNTKNLFSFIFSYKSLEFHI